MASGKIFYNNRGRQVGTGLMSTIHTIQISSNDSIPLTRVGTASLSGPFTIVKCNECSPTKSYPAKGVLLGQLYQSSVEYSWSSYIGTVIPIDFTVTVYDDDDEYLNKTITCKFPRGFGYVTGSSPSFDIANDGGVRVILSRNGYANYDCLLVDLIYTTSGYLYLNTTDYSDSYGNHIYSRYVKFLSVRYLSF